jgi:hypothetical protein
MQLGRLKGAHPGAAGRTSTSSDDQERAERAFRFTGGLLIIGLVLTLGVQFARKAEPSWLGGAYGTYRAVWPQGWNFFANAADNEVVVAFRIGTAGTLTSAISAEASAHNDWGLRRGGYEQLAEIGDLLGRVPADRWVPCQQELALCAADAEAAGPLTLINGSRRPTLCGLVALVRELPVTSQPVGGPGPAWRPDGIVLLRLACGRHRGL